MLAELTMVEQRYLAVREVLDSGAKIADVATRYGVDRRTIHRWLVRYATHGLGALADKSSKPDRCPHQIAPEIEARIIELRRAHPGWGPRALAALEGRGELPRGDFVSARPNCRTSNCRPLWFGAVSPTLLYHAAFFSSPRNLLADLRAISFLAIGLLVAMVAVAATAYHLIDGAPVGRRGLRMVQLFRRQIRCGHGNCRSTRLPRRIVTLLEGDALPSKHSEPMNSNLGASRAENTEVMHESSGVSFCSSQRGPGRS